jgi:hypothetical protein
MIKLTDGQWKELTLVLSSYRADLSSSDGKGDYVEYIDELVNEIIDTQSDWEVEFEMDWDNPVPDDELDE